MRDRVLAPIELARRQDPRQHRSDADRGEEKDEGMRKAKSHPGLKVV
jgi:hypothetical protein